MYVHVSKWLERVGITMAKSSTFVKGAASHPRTFCRAVTKGSYLRNSWSYLHEAKAVVEAFDRVVYNRGVSRILGKGVLKLINNSYNTC